MVARRCVAEPGCTAFGFSVAELAGLLGVTLGSGPGPPSTDSLTPACSTGPTGPSSSRNRHPRAIPSWRIPSAAAGLARHPAPRAPRFLARGAGLALIATALAMLLRCLSRRRATASTAGRLKASWVAEAFVLSLRQVKAARKGLIELGWIEPEDAGQWALNCWGCLPDRPRLVAPMPRGVDRRRPTGRPPLPRPGLRPRPEFDTPSDRARPEFDTP